MNTKNNNIVRLGGSSDGYARPSKTLQDRLSQDQIEEKLRGYRLLGGDVSGGVTGGGNRIADELKPNAHVRYFTETDAGRKFRMGGFVKKIDANKNYMVLTNNTHSWCVDLNKATVYKKIDHDDFSNLEKKYVKLAEEHSALQNNYGLLKSFVKKKLAPATAKSSRPSR
jgi:hypothetical protein